MEVFVLRQELNVSTTALQRFLELDLVLKNKSLALVIEGLVKQRRDGMVRGRRLDNKTLVALEAGENGRLLDLPLANVGELTIGTSLDSVGGLPSGSGLGNELLKENGILGLVFLDQGVRNGCIKNVITRVYVLRIGGVRPYWRRPPRPQPLRCMPGER